MGQLSLAFEGQKALGVQQETGPRLNGRVEAESLLIAFMRDIFSFLTKDLPYHLCDNCLCRTLGVLLDWTAVGSTHRVQPCLQNYSGQGGMRQERGYVKSD